MWLDADDIIEDDDINRFNILKEKAPKETDIIFTIYRAYSESGLYGYTLRDRIIRRSLSPKWEFDVHEGIPVQDSRKCLYASDISVIHKKEYINEPDRNMDIFNLNIRGGKKLTVFEKAKSLYPLDRAWKETRINNFLINEKRMSCPQSGHNDGQENTEKKIMSEKTEKLTQKLQEVISELSELSDEEISQVIGGIGWHKHKHIHDASFEQVTEIINVTISQGISGLLDSLDAR